MSTIPLNERRASYLEALAVRIERGMVLANPQDPVMQKLAKESASPAKYLELVKPFLT